ncbi:hypothetical protein [Dactylosporangium sp. CA-139066]|uniref:hypothetical protein n=1 Tax=Dactylosporangium sp. CA-139066 TaxID=3239930 RepID=UPI003D8D0C0A
MTTAVIPVDFHTRRRAVPQPAEPRIVATPGWGPCPLPWCAEQPGGPGCHGGDTHIAPGGHQIISDRIHTRTVEYVTGTDAEGGDITASVTVTGYEDRDSGVYDVEITLLVGDVAAQLTPAAAGDLFAGLGAAITLAQKPPAAVRPPSGGGRASTGATA